MLKISVFNGDTVSGLVTDHTKIQCDGHDGKYPPKPPVDEEKPPKPPVEEPVKPPTDETKPPEKLPRPNIEGDDEGDEEECSTDDLVPGSVVQEAELVLEDGEAYWTEVELRPPAAG